MKVRVLEQKRKDAGCYTGDLIKGKVYDVISKEKKSGFYRIVDESGEDYIYPPEMFEIVED